MFGQCGLKVMNDGLIHVAQASDAGFCLLFELGTGVTRTCFIVWYDVAHRAGLCHIFGKCGGDGVVSRVMGGVG